MNHRDQSSFTPFERHPVQVRHPFPGTYLAPATWAEALSALATDAGGTRLIAGGTDLLLEIQRGVRTGIHTLVDLRRIPGVDAIEIHDRDDRTWARLGPLVTHNDVVTNRQLVQRALPLAQACLEVASPQLRNRATVVGNVVTASPANDTISALLALGADVMITSVRGERVVPLASFITGFRRCDLAADEAITALEVPLLGASERGMFAKVGNRSAQAISIVHLAAVVAFDEVGLIESARIAVGSVAETVVVLEAAAAPLIGRPLEPETIDAAAAAAAAAISPIDDVRATADYRRSIVATVLRRVLLSLSSGREADNWPTPPITLASRMPPDVGAPTRGHRVEAGTMLSIDVNGSTRSAPGADRTLLDWLRADGSLNGTKEGCAEGECGACTVTLDGSAVLACLVPAAQADGHRVGTVEGLGDGDDLHPVQQAFIDCSAVQCGFCTPGFLVAAERLLNECPVPDREQVERGLAGNLCRCTGYVSVIDAVTTAGSALTSRATAGPGRGGGR